MKKFFKIRKIQTKELADLIAKQMAGTYTFPKNIGVRHLELAVRSLNLQRTP